MKGATEKRKLSHRQSRVRDSVQLEPEKNESLQVCRRTPAHHAPRTAASAQTRPPGPEARDDAKQRQNSQPPAG